MPTAIRSIGPLHLEDLEPHRFEDLVRQLAYDFRPWLSIEPTGRGGSDDGYDARAWERVDVPDEREEDEEEAPPTSRVWLIQCKREKQINPKKLKEYLDGLPQTQEEPIYGIIFAAACDFSKTARDLFRTRTRELGFSEAYLWGKADIEDQIFQPKNDHLLFAYCGFSLQVRKRGLKTEIRSRLSTKRKALKLLENHRPVLIRDTSDDRYPFLDPDKSKERVKRGRWRVFQRGECKHDGIHFMSTRQFAFFDKDDVHWDVAEAMDDGPPNRHFNPWLDEELAAKRQEEREKAMEIWQGFEETVRAWYEIFFVLPYENVLDFDADGDEFFSEGPHVYTAPWISDTPFREYYSHNLITVGSIYVARHCDLDKRNRVSKFARLKT